MRSVQAAWRLDEGGGRGKASPRPRGRRHGRAFPPSTLHRRPPKAGPSVSLRTPSPRMDPLKLGPSSVSRKQ